MTQSAEVIIPSIRREVWVQKSLREDFVESLARSFTDTRITDIYDSQEVRFGSRHAFIRLAAPVARLHTILDATEHNVVRGLQTGGAVQGWGDAGFRTEFQDPHPSSANQVGHFLTSVRLGFDPNSVTRSIGPRTSIRPSEQSIGDRFRSTVGHVVRQSRLLGSVGARDIVAPMRGFSNEEVALRLIIGHEKAPVPMPLVDSGLAQFLRQFRSATAADVQVFRDAEQALGNSHRLDIGAAMVILWRIHVGPSMLGNSYQDLGLSLVGWRFGRLLVSGFFSSNAQVADWLRVNLGGHAQAWSAPSRSSSAKENLVVQARNGFSAPSAAATFNSLLDDVVDPWGPPGGAQFKCPPGFHPSGDIGDIVDPWASDDNVPPEAWGGPPSPWRFGEFLVADLLAASDPSGLLPRFGASFAAAIQKPAKALTVAEADLILVMLNAAGMIQLTSPVIDDGVTVNIQKFNNWVALSPWLRITNDVTLQPTPPALARGRIIYAYRPSDDWSISKSWTIDQILQKRTPIASVDPRFAVALYRIAGYLSQWWNAQAIYHVGINNPASGGHKDGRAIDLSGTLWADNNGNWREFLVLQDWGRKPIPTLPGGPTLWPVTSDDHTHYRLADAWRKGGCAPRFFAQLYRFLHTQLTNNAPSALPNDPDAELGVCSQEIKFPDWSRRAPGKPTGSEAHNNHYHAQIIPP